MNLTTRELVLQKIKDMNAVSRLKEPRIGIDSIILSLNIDRKLVMASLEELGEENIITIQKPNARRHTGNYIGNVSLNVS